MKRAKTVVPMVCCFAVLTLPSLGGALPFRYQQAQGKLKGKVMDFTGAVIPNAPIIIEIDQIEKRVKRNEKGRFEIDLAPGRYHITTGEIPGFQKFVRASFEIRPSQTTTINVIAEFAGDALFYYNSFEAREEIAKLKKEQGRLNASYDSFPISNAAGSELDLLIKYIKKNEDSDSTIYEGAMVSYDTFLLYASEVILHRPPRKLKAKGKVLLDDGKERTWATGVELDFTKSNPISNVIQ
ncbi:MAG TPA: carboxypeptidase regulatory-like domain-containing protein [Blastocatellia bacterium]|nr:carboxypeptidase regulatory-like domain-containing protein [Blastocatellia bacterium]